MLSYIATYCGLILMSVSFCVYSQECRYRSSACRNCFPGEVNRMCRDLCNSCHTQPDSTLNMTACLRCKDVFCSSNCERYWHDIFSGVCRTCRRSFCSTINDQCKNGNFTTIYTEPPRVTKLSEIATSGFTDDKHGLDSTTKQFVEPRNTDKGEVTYEEKTTTPNTAGPLHFTTFIEISSSKFTEDEYKTTKNKTTPVTAGKMGQQNEGGESLVKAAVGSVFIIIAIAIIILYFIKKKAKHGSSKPQSASHEMRNSIYMTNANETNGMEISDNNTTTENHEKNEYACYPRDRQEQLTSIVASEDSPCYSTLRKEEEKSDVILNRSESQYMFLHYDSRANTSSTERQTADTESDYSYTSYPGKSRTDNEEASKESPEYYTLQKEESGVIQKQNASQSKYMVLQHDTNTTANTGPSATERESESEYSYVSYPMKSQTDNEEVPTDLPVSTLQKEQDNDVIDLISNVRVKPNNIDIVKQGGLQSGYMCLKQDGSIRSTTIVPPVHVKADKESDVESEYSYATYQGKGQNQTMPMGNADRSKGYTPKTDQGSVVNNTLNVRSLRNDDAYAELKLGVNDSNEGSYDTLNYLTRTRVPDDVIDDYNKLILTPEYSEESEEYTNLNMTFLKA